MKIVIQCAATKKVTPFGHGIRTTDNRLVKFVAHPELINDNNQCVYAHPDGKSSGSETWRDLILRYNKTMSHSNTLGLYKAYQLYQHNIYQKLVEKFGEDKVFILSAGWGLVSANFLIPDYDITFSKAKNVSIHCQRNKSDLFSDICHLPDDGELTLFIGGKDYQPLFNHLTNKHKGKKTIFYNAVESPRAERNTSFVLFETTQRTNWHYTCAKDLIDGKLSI